MNILTKDTIAAIATAPGTAGIGIIRISGPEAIFIAENICRNSKGFKINLAAAETHTIHYCFVYDDDRMIDEVLVSIMRAPRSYTTEDIVEINCHGGYFIIKQVLELVIKFGARAAEPGEFTKRAFINGRIDLSQAESVMEFISSNNEFARKKSLDSLRGSVLRKVQELRERIIDEAAFIEVVLDDPEHYSFEDSHKSFNYKLNDIINEIKSIIRESECGRIYTNGIKTALIGKTNVGKSTLMNLLSKEERAIVTDIAGTTRDTLETDIRMGDLTLRLIDTAGIRDSDDLIEKIGIKKAVEIIDKADFILFVIDGSRKLSEDDKYIFKLIQDKKCLIIINKSDLPSEIGSDSIKDLSNKPVINISAKHEKAYGILKNAIEKTFLEDGSSLYGEDSIITNERQLQEFRNALKSLLLVKESIDAGMSEDFFTADLMDAYRYLGNIIGEDTEEDLIDKIFKDFCMGK